ncbi:amidohydrolase [Eubacteriales bacterium DFI.9.88]|uniref:Amidohydrolase family protein n=2 Tax=Anaerovoracaceae TaxID=543314 RepID=A0A9J6QV24_9FIRM|nr:amidohydrolase [Hominibacterium faecale]MCU7377750.1 amidohydrolase family protein [Hominibacterium faecale]MDE8732991.1 amidohydrolase [Eubacteriales bacterium DFI.9.88]
MYASYVIRNGEIVTVDGKNSIADTIAVYEDKIVYVGDEQGARSFTGPHTEMIDAQGKSVLPGFIDSHLHLDAIGTRMLYPDCREAACISDIQTIIRKEAEKYPKGTILRAFGYDHLNLKERRHPNRWELDEAAPEHPVYIIHSSYHISAANTKALALIGVDDNICDPEGGSYERIDGKVTGVAFENAHYNFYTKLDFSEEEIKSCLKTADEYLLSRGITTVCSALDCALSVKALTELKRKNTLKIRVVTMPYPTGNPFVMDKYLNTGYHTGFGSDQCRIGPFKLMIDGSSLGGTAAMKRADMKDQGFLAIDQDTLDRMMLNAHLDGFQCTSHAIGDRAVEMLLTSYEKAFKALNRSDCRHRIEHCNFAPKSLIKKISQMGVIPIPQPAFLKEFGSTYYKIYGKQAEEIFPIKSFLKAGICVSFSTDAPIIDANPFVGMSAACNRKSDEGLILGKEERVTLKDAIRMYTYNGAYANFQENITGSLEVGKKADLVVLSDRIWEAAPENISKTSVTLTMIDGEIVYTKVKGGESNER